MISVVIFLCSRVLVAKCWDVLVIVPCYLLNGTPFAKKKDQGLISLSLSLSLSPSPLASSLVRLTFSPFSAHSWILESYRPPDLLSLSLSLPLPSRRGVESRSVSPTVSDLGRLSSISYSWLSPQARSESSPLCLRLSSCDAWRTPSIWLGRSSSSSPPR
jgi:hypothetical protein